MNAFADVQLRNALHRLESAIIALENHADGASPAVLGEAYRNLLQARGQLTAMKRLLDMEEEITTAKPPPRLTVVR